MDRGILFFVNSIFFGIGLAMDAFSVSMANGLNEPEMDRKKEFVIAGAFGVFQTLMPLLGWVLVHTALNAFQEFQRFIPWIALLLLSWIGGKMIAEGIRDTREAAGFPADAQSGAGETGTTGSGASEAERNGKEKTRKLGLWALFVQAVATSIDALSVGFTIAEYDLPHALLESLIIGLVTFAISFAGIRIGKKFGMKLAGKASILGGVILVAIGFEIFVTHL